MTGCGGGTCGDMRWLCCLLVSMTTVSQVSGLTMPRALTCNAVAVRACARRASVVACDAAAQGADVLLLAALDALKGRDAERARKLHAEATEAYDAAGGPSAEQADLLALVGSRVDQAVVPGFGRTAQRPPTPTKQELAARTRAKMEGDTVLMGSVQAFSNKTDSARFGTSYALLDEARACFRRAGSDVERERDAVMGNLFAAIRAEEERAQRVSKLVRMKKMLELVKQKQKAKTLGIDEQDFQESLDADGNGSEAMEADIEAGASSVDSSAADSSLADDILGAWQREGVDASSGEIARMEAEIEDLEDSL